MEFYDMSNMILLIVGDIWVGMGLDHHLDTIIRDLDVGKITK